MKFRALIPVFAAILVLTGVAVQSAQAGMEGFAGLTLPTGDFGDMTKTGYHIGGAYTMPVAPTASIGGWAAYHMMDLDGIPGSMNMFEIMGIARLSAPMGPFAQVGLGLASTKFDPDNDVLGLSTDRSNDLVFAIGGGYSMTVLKITAMYHSISSEGSSTNMLTISAGLGF